MKRKEWNGIFVTGRAICVARLVECEPFSQKHYKAVYPVIGGDERGPIFDDPGDWPDGFAWILEDVRIIDPVHVKGQQRLFTVADELIRPTGQTYEEARRSWHGSGLISEI
jgi:hypothetical protein